MDGVRHPVGDEPSSVYWKRRLAVVVGVVVVALLLWWIASAVGGSSGPAATPPATNSPTVTPTNTVAADPGRACTDADFTVATAVPAPAKASEAPTFTVTVTSIADSPCIVDPTAKSKITIRSGSDHWFDSSKCKDLKTFDAEKFVLDSDGTHELTASWNYGRDDAGCTADLVKAKPGTYKVTATVGGVAASEVSFAVTG